MAVINGTIKGCTLVSKTFTGIGAREVWLLTCDFAAYTGASDTATITGVGAELATRIRDGKTRTLRYGVCAHAGADTANQAVYATGTAVQAMTVSSGDLTGQLSTAALAEITSSTASKGCGMLVGVDVS
jgi:hypothetical protein